MKRKIQPVDDTMRQLREELKEQYKEEKKQQVEIRELKKLDSENVKQVQDYTGVHDVSKISELVDLIQYQTDEQKLAEQQRIEEQKKAELIKAE